MTPLKRKLSPPPGHRGLLVTQNQQAEKGVPELAGVTDPGHRGEMGLLLHSRGEDEHVRYTRGRLGRLLELPFPAIKVRESANGPGGTANGLDTPGIKA